MTTTATAHHPRRDTATFCRVFLKRSGLGKAGERLAGRDTSRDQSTHLLESRKELVVAEPVGETERDRRKLIVLAWQRRMILRRFACQRVVDRGGDSCRLLPLCPVVSLLELRQHLTAEQLE